MKFLRSLTTLGLLLIASTAAFAQGAILQGGATTPGHIPMYITQGTGQTVVQDSGGAGGGAIGIGLSELSLTARGTGTPPFAGQGTGPLGTNFCDYDAPTTNATGYHYLCFSANAQGGGLIAYGAGGTAAQLPLTLNLNGATYQFPFSAGGISGPVTSIVGDVVLWNNTTGSLVKDGSLNQNAVSAANISNTSAGTSAAAGYNVSNGTGNVTFGLTGTGYTAIANLQNRAVITADAGTSGIALATVGSSPIAFQTNNTFAGGITALQQWSIGPNFAPATNTGGAPILLTINGTATAPPNTDKSGSNSNYMLHIIGPNSNSVPSGINLMQFGNGAQVYPGISMHRGDGTAASPSAVVFGDVVGHIGIHPRSTTDWSASGPAFIRWFAGENFDDTHQGTYMSVFTTANGTASAQVETISFQGALTKLGGIDKISPTAATLAASSVITGTSNTAGVNTTFNLSQGTGTGGGGDLIWQVAPAGSTGSAQNALIEAMRLRGTGAFSVGLPGLSTVNFTVNKNTAAPAASTNALANFVGPDGVAAALFIDAYDNSTPLGGPQVFLRRSKGTQASPSALTSGFSLGSVLGIGYGATGYIAAGSTGGMVITAGETFTDSSALTYLDFYTTATGSTTITNNMRLWGSSGLSVGNSQVANDPTSGVVNVSTGFRIANAATSANVLRGNGTNFVSATLAASDLSNGVTGTGAVALATSPSFTTPTLGVASATSITTANGALNGLILTAAAGTNAGLNMAVGGSLVFQLGSTLDTFAVNDHNGTTIFQVKEATPGTTSTTQTTFLGGVVIGAPTGGNQGSGTLNVATNVFLNNTAYTNPDYVFEKFYTGKIEKFADKPGAKNYRGQMPLADLRNYTRDHLRLPGIVDEPTGIFTMADIALAKIEEATLYILDLNERLERLQADNDNIRAELQRRAAR